MNKVLKKLKPIFDYLSENYGCKAMIISGSYIIPHIKNNHDIDIVTIFDQDFSFMDIRKDSFFSEKSQELKKDNIVFLFRRQEREQYDLISNVWGYESMYYRDEYMLGDIKIDTVHILSDIDAYKDAARSFIKYIDSIENPILYNFKNLYHILTCIYFIENNSYELTECQINNINIVHDCEDEESVMYFYYKIKEWLGMDNKESGD